MIKRFKYSILIALFVASAGAMAYLFVVAGKVADASWQNKIVEIQSALLRNQIESKRLRHDATTQQASVNDGIADRQHQILDALKKLQGDWDREMQRRTADRYTGHDADNDWARQRQFNPLLPARRPSATQALNHRARHPLPLPRSTEQVLHRLHRIEQLLRALCAQRKIEMATINDIAAQVTSETTSSQGSARC